MSYRNRFYPPEIVDWYDDDFDRQTYTYHSNAHGVNYYGCYPICCPSPFCFPQNCEPSMNYATCCPNPNSMYNTVYTSAGCMPSQEGYTATACTPYGCSPNCGPNFCNPRGCRPRGCRPR